ncbi:glutamate synthase [NADH] [Monosporozyma unispora]|nr:glutamate synthase [NADH] [Kazachstania unispora]
MKQPTNKIGLYNPDLERDACGVGFIATKANNPRHDILMDAKQILVNMTHRGASHKGIGDGAGILLSIPHDFIKRESKLDNFPELGTYAIGNVFFHNLLFFNQDLWNKLAAEQNLQILEWRDVPVDSSILNPTCLDIEPAKVLQPIFVPTTKVKSESDLRQRLYIFRKKLEKIFHHDNGKVYICSLSDKVMVYKGQLTPAQVFQYYKYDLEDPDFKIFMGLVHSRFSTNTFPSWDRAQPLRWIAHNGEINTLRGNINWVKAREGSMKTENLGDLNELFPIIPDKGSDSAAVDNMLELLVTEGVLSLPEAIMMMVPEANKTDMDKGLKSWYDWAACLMEPWDGPALLNFTDGRYVGARLDRNGLRPCRYYVTSDDRIICASEVGVVQNIDERLVVAKGKIRPGDLFLVDTENCTIINQDNIKHDISTRENFSQWLENKTITLDQLTANIPIDINTPTHGVLDNERLLANGFTFELIGLLLAPMALTGKEALGSMGNDAPLACLNEAPVMLFDYFKQLFAQVTNPPIDPIREANVMSLECFVGPQGNLLEMNENQCERLRLETPILTKQQFNAIENIEKVHPSWSVGTIDITFNKSEGLAGYKATIERIIEEAHNLIVKDNKQVIIISDKNVNKDRVSIASLIAVSSIHHQLIRKQNRADVALVLETSEAKEIHDFCLILGYGCDAIYPSLAMETLVTLNQQGLLRDTCKNEDQGLVADDKIISNYIYAIDHGIMKVMSKMGISTLASYKGAQIFEALGLDDEVVDLCFTNTASRIKGATFDILAQDAFTLHERGFPAEDNILPAKPVTVLYSGEYHWRHGGMKHINDPSAIANLQDSVRNKDNDAWNKYIEKEMAVIRDCTLRGLLEFDYDNSTEIPLDEVEPWTVIAKRFTTGAMSYGSISAEAHTTLAIAMNRIGAKSNCGEGGEDAERSEKLANGDTMRSAIKQVASGRFGVTSYYLSDADQLQIKVAQGAKPGEGGELPAHKVSKEIAKTRHSTPNVGLISPPPHHDIYSIEDLKQLIYDLKCANPIAEVSVKLVSEVGVGIIASGVAKAKADHITISGHDGGTGAARWTSIKHAGLPWELGLAEAQQTLVLNDLRDRVVLQTDGQLRTGFDIAVAVLLGAESFTLATIPLIVMGCIMLRRCHTNTCAVGIATQDPYLRSKFKGQPEHVINFFFNLIEDFRKIMAKLGYRTVEEMVGRTEKLRTRSDLGPKTSHIDLAALLKPSESMKPEPEVSIVNTKRNDVSFKGRIDNTLIEKSEASLNNKTPTVIENVEIINTDLTVGATLGYTVSKKFGETGLPQDTISVGFHGHAGQSFGAFLPPGITFKLEGDANDYVGKGLSGGRLIIRPEQGSTLVTEENVIVGNTCFYGATSGAAFISGSAGERFAVRNSGAEIVIESIIGGNAFEYMTGGRAIVLTEMSSINAFSGATGGIIYCYSEDKEQFKININMETIELADIEDEDSVYVKKMVQEHFSLTGSKRAESIIAEFHNHINKFVKVIPTDYKKALAIAKEEAIAEAKAAAIKAAEAKQANGSSTSHKSTVHEPKLQDLEDYIPEKKPAKKVGANFIKYRRKLPQITVPPSERLQNWDEFQNGLSAKDIKTQASRCMDCGTPFCQSDLNYGCPVSNMIPQFNNFVARNEWELALKTLLSTNNFPEFTGRVCPAPCEGSCTLGISDDPVGIKSIERQIIEVGYKNGWMKPNPPSVRTDKTVAIIGSGPAGLACAEQLNKIGHNVTIFERSDRFGGLLMYGIPNMKLDKSIIERRLTLMKDEGIKFINNTEIGKDIMLEDLKKDYDAVVFAVGSTIPRDLSIKGREFKNIEFAMSLLEENTKALLSNELSSVRKQIEGKKVIVIGGGDTGNDCLATATRHGAKSVINFELLPQPVAKRNDSTNPWPQWPVIMRVDYGHEEVKERYGNDPREYCIMSKEFIGDSDGNVTGIKTIKLEWTRNTETKRWEMKEIPGSEEIFEADLVLLSMGFTGPNMIKNKTVETNERGNIKTTTPESYQYNTQENIFVAGDCRRGQSLIVWAIQEGRRCARSIDTFLEKKTSYLPDLGGNTPRTFNLLEEEIAASA